MLIYNSYLRLQLADPLAQSSQLLPHLFVLLDDLCLRAWLGHAAADAVGRPPKAYAGNKLCETVGICYTVTRLLWFRAWRCGFGAQATKTT